MELVEGRTDVTDVDAFLDELAAIGEATGCTVQAFDARYVLGRPHLERALELADRAFARGENVARDRAVEVMLYAAGRRQIDRALAMGVDEGEHPVVVLVEARGSEDDDRTRDGRDGDDGAGAGSGATEDAETAAAERVADLLAPAATLDVEHADTELVRSFFEVSDAELEATAADLQALVLERVALLDVEK